MVLKGLLLAFALIASFVAGGKVEEKKSEPTPEQKIEIQVRQNNLELYGTEDGFVRGLRNKDSKGDYYYALYVQTDDERVWDATVVEGVDDETKIIGYAVCRYYPGNDTLIQAFEGKAWDDDEDNMDEIILTDSSGNKTRIISVYTTLQEFELVLDNLGDENSMDTLIKLGVVDSSYSFTSP